MSNVHAFSPLNADELAAAAKAAPAHAKRWVPVAPIPADARDVERWAKANLPRDCDGGDYVLSKVWPYRSATGQTMFYVARFDSRKRWAKVIRPITYGAWRRGELGAPAGIYQCWNYAALPGGRPLYRLPVLARPGSEQKVVLLVGGEKAADAAVSMFPTDYVVTTSSGGESAILQTDWSPLAGRHLVIWPDSDKAGQIYAERAGAAARKAGAASVRVVSVPTEWKNAKGKGWDLADPLPDGVKPVDIRDMIEAATDLPEPEATASGEEPLSFGPFAMHPLKGLSFQREEGKAEWICAAFDFIGRARAPDGTGWGRLLQWTDDDGRQHDYVVTDAALQGEVAMLAADLASHGLTITTAPGTRRHLASYLNQLRSDGRVTLVSRTGWHNVGNHPVFVMPGQTIGAAGAEKVRLTGNGHSAAGYGAAGTLADWSVGVGALVVGHVRPTFAVSLAFVGPLLGIAGLEGCGFNIYGESSKGKSTCAEAAASVWGKGSAIGGFVQTARATDNGLEGVATAHSDTLLAVDEIGMMDARVAGQVAYMLANGRGKSRAARDGSAKEATTWRCPVLYTGETTMGTKIAEGGRRPMAGQAVRVIDLSQDAGKGFGVFDSGGSTGDARDLANAIKRAATTAYGTAGPEFVRHILDTGWKKVAKQVRDAADTFAAQALNGKGDGQVKRAAQMFALVGVAGELARSWGIVPWKPGVALGAARSLFQSWIEGRGGTEGAERMDAVRQVRRFLEAHGDARFDDVNGGAAERGYPSSGADRPVFNRAGWRKGSDSERVWLILPEAWKAEVCNGIDPKMTASVLAELGYLVPDNAGKNSRLERTPLGVCRVYVIRASILEGDGER